MTLVQLRHLIALVESGSFSRAAEALFLTQPALSRSIRALEEEMGQALFDRLGRRIELTAFGRDVLQRARQIVFEVDELAANGRQQRDGRAGSLRVGMGSGPGAMLMTPLLLEMARRHPLVHLTVSRGSTDRLLQGLRERELDALVVDALSVSPAPDLELVTLAEMRGVFMCRPGHPLLRAASVRFPEVRKYPIASTPLSDEVARMLVELYGPAAHPEACVTLRCEEIASLVDVARQSDAVLLAIRASAPDLVELPMKPAVGRKARFGLVTLAGRSEPPALSIVRDLAQRLLRD
ncbi:LysR family transcriptional regulator [Ramlibacter sp. USB13]|uniref:LysR family transcriptional regulator n=1 Tax=Ramlibacter cellulosilyticus TaxID=2764187 RepID=A0A923MPG3_9BURK|nr:LysR family transcriptional regulator [Ramlibacter cellulosilyticus]MBC5782159.1 LysR family transcriptional regulator [Ramlibacter cellulosilyticus]